MSNRTAGLRACFRIVVLALCVVLAACATDTRKMAIDRVQYAYSAAVRWGDFEGAWQLVDPAYRNAHPMSDLDLERYKQVQVTAYHDLAANTLPDGDMVREIEIGLVNRHTLVERTTRYTEHWHYDAQAKTWWLVNGLPDFWQGG